MLLSKRLKDHDLLTREHCEQEVYRNEEAVPMSHNGSRGLSRFVLFFLRNPVSFQDESTSSVRVKILTNRLGECVCIGVPLSLNMTLVFWRRDIRAELVSSQ